MVNELGIALPSLVYFENRIPHLFEGDLNDEDQVLSWLLHQLGADEIEEVTDEMLDQLIASHPYVAALFCKSTLGPVPPCCVNFIQK